MSLEYQRYGRNKSALINSAYIDSGEYRRKFDKITDNPEVNRVLYSKAKEMLKHRSGTMLEDMYWIDSVTGKVIAKEIASSEASAITYSETTKKAVSAYKPNIIISIHTHPGSMPPSAADFNSCCANRYLKGCIACHDGKVFVYKAFELINETLYHMYIETALKDGASEYEAQIKALNELKRNYRINFWEA